MNTDSMTKPLLIAVLATALAGCGGGSDDGAADSTGARTFISWSNSANGVVVVDASNERFAFYGDTKCLYSYNTTQEIGNFCLGSNSSGSFAGQSVSVQLVRAAGGGCIAALADPSGYQVDIFTNASGVPIVQATTTRWDITGCTA